MMSLHPTLCTTRPVLQSLCDGKSFGTGPTTHPLHCIAPGTAPRMSINAERNTICAGSDDCAMGIERYTISLDRQPEGFPLGGVWAAADESTVVRGERAVTFTLPGPGVYRGRVCGAAVTGLTSCATAADLTYDSTPPRLGVLCLGLGASAQCAPDAAYFLVGSASALVVNWRGFSDLESGVQSYHWTLRDAISGNKMVPKTLVSTERAAFFTLPSVAASGAVFNISCTNGARLETSASFRLVPETHALFLGGAVLLEGLQQNEHGVYLSHETTVTVRVARSQIASTSLVSLALTFTTDGGEVEQRALSVDTQIEQVESFLLSADVVYTVTCEAKTGSAARSASAPLRMRFAPVPLEGSDEVIICGSAHGAVATTVQSYTTHVQLCATAEAAIPGAATHLQASFALADSGQTFAIRSAMFSQTRANVTGIALPCGEQLRVTLQWMSGDAQLSLPRAHALLVDCTPPSGGIVRIGETYAVAASDAMALSTSAASVACVQQGRLLLARWSGFDDPESAPLSFRYSLASEWTEAGGVEGLPLNSSSLGLAVQHYLRVQVTKYRLLLAPALPTNA